MMRKIAAILAVVLLPSEVYAQDEMSKQPLSFQGINNATTYDELRVQFPSAEVLNNCKPDEDVLTFKNGQRHCNSLIVPDYNVNGIAFNRIFAFYPNGHVSLVSLSYSFGTRYYKDKTPKSAETLRELYKLFRGAISAKYGDELKDPPCRFLDTIYESPRPKRLTACSEWIFTQDKKWSGSADKIRLNILAGDYTSDENEDYSGDLQISYEFVDRSFSSAL